MSPFEQLLDRITAWIAGFDPVSLVAQVCALLLAFAAGLLAKRWYLRRYRGGPDAPAVAARGLRHLTHRSLERIVHPLGMLVLVSALRGVLATFGFNVHLLDIAVPVLASLAVIRVAVYLLRKALGDSRAVKAWEQVIAGCVWVIVALHLLGWLPAVLHTLDALAMTVGETRISLLSLFKLVVMVTLLIALAMWVSRVLERRLARSAHISRTMQVGIAKFAKFFLLALAVLIALDSVGFNLSSLAVFSGALGVGLGFGLQRIASNFISGFILIGDRSIKPGDVISIGTKFGWVQEMRARYIVVRNRDGEDTLIPNENLITSEVINWRYADPNVRMKIPVQISYRDDPEQALAILLEAARVNPRVLADPPPAARLIGFGESGIDLELRVWYNDPENGVANIRSDINLAIWRAFKAAGITIPYPQRDVHLHPVGAPSATDAPGVRTTPSA